MPASTDGSRSWEGLEEVSSASLTVPKPLTSAFSQVAAAPGSYLPEIWSEGCLYCVYLGAGVGCVACSSGRSLSYCLEQGKMVQTLWESTDFLLKTKENLPYDSAIPLLDIDLRKMKTSVHWKTCTQMFIAAVSIYNCQELKQHKVLSAGDGVHSTNGILLGSKKGSTHWHREQHGWTPNALCWVKEARLKRLHTVWFHL